MDLNAITLRAEAASRNLPPSVRELLIKMLRVMKLTAILLLAVGLQVNAIGFTQTISFKGKNVPLKQFFTAIEKQSDYIFFYKTGLLDNTSPITIDVKNSTVEAAVKEALRNQPLDYVVEDKTILIKAKAPIKAANNVIEETVLLPIRGTVKDSEDRPLAGASISVKGRKEAVISDEKGDFEINAKRGDVLVISYVGFERQEVKVESGNLGRIVLRLTTSSLAGIEVQVSTGYQTLAPERTTGSFSTIGKDLITRGVTPNVLNRMENYVPGIQFNYGDASPSGNDRILIRGRSTIFSNSNPLIVLDNFPYDGDISNINPNDVESITLLKDAAAASIWGARSGNGVIVITTKRGRLGKPQVELNSSVNITQRPDLFNVRSISSSDFIELEKYFYAKGAYNSLFTSVFRPAISPVVELLRANPSDVNAQIEAMKAYDVRNDIKKYFYQTGIDQQHALNVSGATANSNYYMSAGWDHSIPNPVGQKYDRISLRTQNSFRVTTNLQIDAGINFVQSNTQNGNNPGSGLNAYPYARLVDDNGNALVLNNLLRGIYTDTVGGGKLLNWKYKPVDDIGYTKSSNKIRDYLVNAGIRYDFTSYLSAEFKYQYENSVATGNTLFTESSFTTRNLINRFYQPNATNKFPIPVGGIVDRRSSEIVSHQGRAQLNYNQNFNTKHLISAVAGWEIKDMRTTGNSNRLYGYKEQGSIVNTQIDFNTNFTQLPLGSGSLRIPNLGIISRSIDRFISYYANASYTYDERYTISASSRTDAANLLGVKTNQKGVPLWSVGAAWQISKEAFYRLGWLSMLKLRAAYGYNGNFSRVTSALPTATFSTSSITPAIMATIETPPNPALRWEQVGILNFGVDFGSKNKKQSGSIEYYRKNAKDLLSPVLVDPTYGTVIGQSSTSTIYKNTANMKGHGFDVQLNSLNLDGKLKWFSNFIFSYSFTKVTKYLIPVSGNGSIYLNTNNINPIVGKPVYAMYSYYWGGLDPATGDPIGYIGQTPSTNYTTITTKTTLDSLVYNGPVQPTYFGALMNTFNWKNLSLSFNISYKFGYYFRRPSVRYGTGWSMHADYALRWQKPGDELYTNVPSLVYPINSSRNDFYANSEILVEKADNIRLEDIRLAYTLDRARLGNLPFKQIRLYAYASNLGTLWVANKSDIDPSFNNVPKTGKSIAFGINVSF